MEGVICGFGHRRRLTLYGGGVEDLNCVAVNPLGERWEPNGEVKCFCEARRILQSRHLKEFFCTLIRSILEHNCHSLDSFPTTI